MLDAHAMLVQKLRPMVFMLIYRLSSPLLLPAVFHDDIHFNAMIPILLFQSVQVWVANDDGLRSARKLMLESNESAQDSKLGS